MPATARALRDHPHCRSAAIGLLTTARAQRLDMAPIRCALHLAARGHEGQYRHSGEPFIAHPLAVSAAVVQLQGSTTDAVTGLVHDLLEDCQGITVETLLRQFGQQVTGRLLALTKRPDLPKHQRVDEAHSRLLQAVHCYGPGLALVKLLDRAHNAATSAVLSADRLQRLQAENERLFAPLARHVGAHGLAAFLLAEPAHWWRAAHDFPERMRQFQAPLPFRA